MNADAQSQSREQALLKKLRSNFKLSKQKIKQSDINIFVLNLKSCSMIQIKILDSIFFKQLCQRINKLSYIQVKNIKFQKLVEMIQAKLAFFGDVIIQYRTSLDQYLRIRDRQAIAEGAILTKQQNNMLDFMLPFTRSFLTIYDEKCKIEPLKLSRSQIDEARINFDKQLTNFIKDQIEKLMPVNNESFKKDQSNKIIKKSFSDLYFHQKDFIEKIMFKIKQFDQKYNPLHKENLKKFNLFSTSLDLVKQNIQIQQCVPTKCVNCNQFFYKDFQFHDQFNSLVDYEIVPSVKSIKKPQQKDKILEDITAFLNRGNGTLLFDCEPTTFGFIPVGFEMSLKEQQAYKYSFQNLFKYIRQESYQKSIESEIDFIPLKKYPSLGTGQVILDPRQPYVQREYVRNWYVMRVKIKSKSERQFFGCQIDFKTYHFLRNNRKTQQVACNEVYTQNKMKTLHMYRFKSINEIKSVQNKLEDKKFKKVIKGQREYRKNVHQGQCKQTRILSIKNNTKQQIQSSSRRY